MSKRSMNEMETSANSRKKTCHDKFCPHCNAYVSRSTYYNHAALYFDKHTMKWTKGDQTIEEQPPSFTPPTYNPSEIFVPPVNMQCDSEQLFRLEDYSHDAIMDTDSNMEQVSLLDALRNSIQYPSLKMSLRAIMRIIITIIIFWYYISVILE